MGKTFALFFFVTVFSGCGFTPLTTSEVSGPGPVAVRPGKLKSYIEDIPSDAVFAYSDLRFYQGDLYAATNVGLLQIRDGQLINLFKWTNGGDVVSSLWNNLADGSLWIYHFGNEKFFRYDGSQWASVDRGIPEKGFYDRGDVLHGYTAFSNADGFWVQGADTVWKWNDKSNAWDRVPTPSLRCQFEPEHRGDKRFGCFAGFAPLKDDLLVLMHGEYFSRRLGFNPDTSLAPRPVSDRVFYWENERWNEVSNESVVDLLSKDVVATPSAAYIATYYKTLFRVTRSEISKIEVPGEIEAMTATTDGNLLVSFTNLGIYEYQNGWQKRFDSPYPSSEPEHFARIAESGRKVAFAISSKPVTKNRVILPSSHTYPGQTALWVSHGNEMKIVELY